MNLHKQGLSDYLWEILLIYQNDPYYKNFHLVGGTALTLQIGHRISEDIDCTRRVHTPPFRALKKGMYPETNTLPKQHTPPFMAGLLIYLQRNR